LAAKDQVSSELQSDVHSGGAIWWMLTGWRPSVVDWGGGVFVGCLPRVQLFVSTCNRWPHLALHHYFLLLINCYLWSTTTFFNLGNCLLFTVFYVLLSSVQCCPCLCISTFCSDWLIELPLPMIQHGWSGFPVRRAIKEFLALALALGEERVNAITW